MRSDLIKKGVERTPNRAMLRAVGFGDEDFGKPIIGVANCYSNLTPCNVGLNDLADKAMEALSSANAMPQVFGTITVSDGISMGTEGMKFLASSREKSSPIPSRLSATHKLWMDSSRSVDATRTCPAR